MKAIYIATTLTVIWLAFIAYQTHQLKLKDSNANRPNNITNIYRFHLHYNPQELTNEHHYI